MDWLRDLIGEELYKQIEPKLKGQNIINLKDGNYIPKSKFDEKNEELKLTKQQIEEYKNKNTDIEKLLKDNTEYKSKLDQLNSDFNAKLESKNKEIEMISKKSILSKKLKESGAIYEDLLMKSLNLDDIKLDGENLSNFNIDEIKSKYPSMFEHVENSGNAIPNVNNNQGIENNKKVQLIEAYNKAEQQGNFVECLNIRNQIKQIE